jgi:hypothetical protein
MSYTWPNERDECVVVMTSNQQRRRHPDVAWPLIYLLPGGTMPFMRRYSTICP